MAVFAVAVVTCTSASTKLKSHDLATHSPHWKRVWGNCKYALYGSGRPLYLHCNVGNEIPHPPSLPTCPLWAALTMQ